MDPTEKVSHFHWWEKQPVLFLDRDEIMDSAQYMCQYDIELAQTFTLSLCWGWQRIEGGEQVVQYDKGMKVCILLSYIWEDIVMVRKLISRFSRNYTFWGTLNPKTGVWNAICIEQLDGFCSYLVLKQFFHHRSVLCDYEYSSTKNRGLLDGFWRFL
jgi:hypothetical protein